MRKILTIVLILSMLVGIAACKGNNSGGTGAVTTDAGSVDSGASGSGSGNGTTAQSGGDAEPAKLTGKLNLIDLDDRDPSVLRGVTIKGNCAGTADGFNNRESSLTDVRCIFELNEWIEFY
ncbi:MAG: hypothetical protein J6330_04535, partial [Clostridia bacterium]|nr:hypothetical protein [Clostridia bacterium]